MTNLKAEDPNELVRSSVLVTRATDQALRQLAAQGRRPLSWEIREALERHVAEHHRGVAA